MILRNSRERRNINKNFREDISFIEKRLKEIRLLSDTLVICPRPTGSNWLGINLATKNLFKESTFDFPQYFSKSVYNSDELNNISKIILNQNYKQVIFSGFPEYFEQIAEHLKKTDSKVITGVVYHGTLSEFGGDKNSSKILKKIIDLRKSGRIDKLGFVRKDLAVCVEKLTGIKTFEIILNPYLEELSTQKLKFQGNSINIGILSGNTFNKNVHNQIAAALMIENAVVHILDGTDPDYWNLEDRIIKHKPADRMEFLQLLGSMDINLYCSFSESWGQIVTESLSLGVLCICSSTNEIFRFDEALRKELCIERFDNPEAIAKFIESRLLEKKTIARTGLEYIEALAKKSDIGLKKFLNEEL